MRGSLGNLGRELVKKVANSNQAPKPRAKTVYLTHVKWVTGKEQLKSYFSKYGQVESVNMFFRSTRPVDDGKLWFPWHTNDIDAETGLHRGFASLTFGKPESVTAAMEHRPHVIDGDRVDVELYVPMKTKTKDVQF